jgi:flagellar hook-associated protein FlgK
MNLTVKNQVDKINEYGHKIKELNDKIVSIEAAGVEKANDLKDERDFYLDELSSMANISYSEDSWGYVSVKLEGVDFVKNDLVYEIALEANDETGFYTPYWKQLANYTLDHNGNKVYHIEGAEVFDLTKPIQTELNTDIGGVKGCVTDFSITLGKSYIHKKDIIHCYSSLFRRFPDGNVTNGFVNRLVRRLLGKIHTKSVFAFIAYMYRCTHLRICY